MKILSALFMIVAALGLIIAVIWRLMEKPFPVAHLPPDSIIEFVSVCLLFAIALGVHSLASKQTS